MNYGDTFAWKILLKYTNYLDKAPLPYNASPFLPDEHGETTFDMLEKFKFNDEWNFMVEVMHAISERYQTYSENR
jgi:hypothetical protein